VDLALENHASTDDQGITRFFLHRASGKDKSAELSQW